MSRPLPLRVATVLSAALAALGPTPARGQEQPRAAGTDVPVPKRTKFVQPQYPAEALALGLRGIVILSLTIDGTGKVSAVDVMRSLPPFDEPAVAAARQWEYEPTKVSGKPVPVRLTVPITFALRLPEMERAAGIPELRQGVAPPFPSGASSRETTSAVADLTVDPSGQVVEAEITSGGPPFSEVLMQALRTWRFTPPGGDHLIEFQVRADFVGSGRGAPRVDLKLTGLREAGPAPVPSAEPAGQTASAQPSPTPPSAEPPTASGTPLAAPAPPPPPQSGAASPGTSPATPAPPASPAAPSGTEAEPQAPAAAGQPAKASGANENPSSVPAATPPKAVTAPAAPAAPSGTEAEPRAPASSREREPGSTSDHALASSGERAPASSTDRSSAPAAARGSAQDKPAAVAPPPVEIIPPAAAAQPAPPPAPRESGVSAIQDVSLGAGVPDLSKGRRPVVPPLARMNGVSGPVEVRFIVEPSGATSVREVTGPELLKEAARQTVASWVFRRTSPERLPLRAAFSYLGDAARASVELIE